ncbi:hypothetical protein OS189_18385 [Sulfitobacter sp. F26169L]|uniref:hypothetical protein n=1 Tax=Sulfitobacter sp. F26169L TaxID=2996015 RepID=UPI002260F8EB|nr:hypothetical protein [Sulfitobacter sp. F26169L]MCX7568310.1 hypothetical protein [Sulfitobacter sp. F26169L]
MSNFEEENQSHADHYHRKLKQIQEREAERAPKLDSWANAKEPKPTIEFLGGRLKTEKEMHQEAHDFADRKAQEQQKIDQVGLPQTPKKAVTFEDKLRAKLGAEKVEKAKEQRREAQRAERKLGKDRQQGL